MGSMARSLRHLHTQPTAEQLIILTERRWRPIVAAQRADLDGLRSPPWLRSLGAQQQVHGARIGATKGERSHHRLLQRRRAILACQQQHLNHRFSTVLLALTLLESGPELVVARRPPPLRPPLRQRRRSGQSPWLLQQHLKVMLQVEHLLLPPEATLVAREQAAVLPQLNVGGIHLGLHHTAHRRRHRVEVGQHLDAGARVHLRKANPRQIEAFFRQRRQVFLLQPHRLTDALRAPADDAPLIVPRSLQQQRVELLQTAHLRHRHQVVATKVAVLHFDAAFLVPFAGRTELRLKAPMRPKGDEAFRFLPLLSAQDLLHRTAQIVVPQHGEDAPEVRERPLVRFQKGLLAGVRIGAVKPRPTGHAAHAEDINLLPFALDLHPGFVPVDLTLLPKTVRLRNEGLAAQQPQRNLPLPYVLPHRRLRHPHFRELGSQSTPNAMRRVSLLARRLPIRFQYGIDERHPTGQLRSLSSRHFALPRNRVAQRLAHQAAMYPQLPRHPVDGPSPVLILTPDLLE